MDPRAARFLERLADPDRPRLTESTVALVLAHPDDETIALGSQLPRIPDLTVVVVTDGAPRDGQDARAHGFVGPADYAETRRKELLCSLALAGVEPGQVIRYGIPDQEAVLHLSDIVVRLVDLLARFDLVVTHAYEGGHPDHDAVAFAVAAAARSIAEKGRLAPAILETPFYHAVRDGWGIQTFCDVSTGGEPGLTLDLHPGERRLKRWMMEAHVTQRRVLALFGDTVERVRAAPEYDFTRPANGGALLYERFGWGITGEIWSRCVAEARAAFFGAEA